MILRLSGMTVAVFGVALIVPGIMGAHQADDRALHHLALALSRQANEQFDPCDWQRQWYLASIVASASGAAFAAGGAAMVLLWRWGLVVVAATFGLMAAYPWALELMGADKYPFEKPGWIDTPVLVAVACAALYGYRASRRTTANATMKNRR
jgi:hypothetical protein